MTPALNAPMTYTIFGREFSTRAMGIIFFAIGYLFGLLGAAVAGIICFGLYRAGYIEQVPVSDAASVDEGSLKNPLADEENNLTNIHNDHTA